MGDSVRARPSDQALLADAPGAASVSALPGDGPSRVMPSTWFRASTSATTMGFIIPREGSGQERVMPLQEGERLLGWFILPPFQRPPVWTQAQQVRFIESCWMGLPIGAIVYNRGQHNSRFDTWLLDGQQRVTAVMAYMADEFPVYGYRYSQLGVVDLRRWSMTIAFPSLVMQSEDEGELRDVYDRLAYGGTPHPPRDSDRHPEGGNAVPSRSDESAAIAQPPAGEP